MPNLEQLNQLGLIPGPTETESDFLARAQFCQNLKQELTHIEADLPFKSRDEASEAIFAEPFKLSQSLYGIAPTWIPLFLSNYQLTPWHGGCAWIFQLNEETPTSAFLQLRQSFRHKQAYLGLYQRDELIAHELAHVGRMMYEEPQFEEFFAYQTSSSTFRRWIGPIVQSSKETLLFIILMGSLIMADIALLAVGHTYSSTWVLLLKLLPFFLIGLALIRLTWRHHLLKRCQRQLEKVYANKDTARHLLYRLRDEEIRLFARFSPDEIKNWFQAQQNHSFRWHFLARLYPPPV